MSSTARGPKEDSRYVPALLLQPGPLDGELVGARLRPGCTGGPPGRGLLLGDPAWAEECAAGPVRVQVAR